MRAKLINNEIDQLIKFLSHWLIGGDKFKNLQKTLNIDDILEIWPKFNYSGNVYRVVGSKILNKPIDFNNFRNKSFSSSLEGIATTLDIWRYGGMIHGDTNNLPVYFQKINKGLDINKMLNYVNNIWEKERYNLDWYKQWDDLNLTNYEISDEIISNYNNPQLVYIISEHSHSKSQYYQDYSFITPENWKTNKFGKIITSRLYA